MEVVKPIKQNEVEFRDRNMVLRGTKPDVRFVFPLVRLRCHVCNCQDDHRYRHYVLEPNPLQSPSSHDDMRPTQIACLAQACAIYISRRHPPRPGLSPMKPMHAYFVFGSPTGEKTSSQCSMFDLVPWFGSILTRCTELI